MAYTTLAPEEIRSAVYEEAKKQFLMHGIAKTEMKQLAQTVGIGRTTLYRYFSSIDCLAFLVIREFIEKLHDSEEQKLVEPLSGYEGVLLHYDRLIDAILTHPEVMRYCTEFDMRYALGYPDIPEAQAYLQLLRTGYDYEVSLILKGHADGSIRPNIQPFTVLSGVGQSLFGYAQRTVAHTTPIEEKRVIMRWLAHSMLETIRT